MNKIRGGLKPVSVLLPERFSFKAAPLIGSVWLEALHRRHSFKSSPEVSPLPVSIGRFRKLHRNGMAHIIVLKRVHMQGKLFWAAGHLRSARSLRGMRPPRSSRSFLAVRPFCSVRSLRSAHSFYSVRSICSTRPFRGACPLPFRVLSRNCAGFAACVLASALSCFSMQKQRRLPRSFARVRLAAVSLLRPP